MKRKNDNTEGGRKRKRSPIAVFLCLVLIGIAVVAVFWIWRTGRLPASANGRNIYRGEEVQDKIISSGDGDYLLRPGTNALKYDKTAGAFYFEGLLMVFLASEPSDDQAWELAEAVDGQIAGMVKGDANLLQIRTEEKDFAGLQELAERLMQEEEVLYARYDYPVFPEENLTGQDTNPWISDDKKDEGYNSFDESNPSGYNWWAEAIGAYTAWQYTDQCSDYKIGIVDNGYKFDHEELQGKMFMLEGTASRISDHGTHVAGIIGAENNYAGIRGIADTADLLVVDWTQEDERKESYIGSGEVLALIGNMTEQGVQVVNNSWSFGNLPSYWNGYVFGSDNQGFFKMSRGDYNEYIESKKNYATQTGMDALITINQLLMAGNERFLIVQSAGNGYNGSGKDGGYDSKWNGHFCSMVNARERYESTVQKFYEKTNRKCASYTEIRDHALIVSGVKNERNNSGQYQIESNFNYGDDVDIYAPGKDIYSTLAEENYGKSDGTSMAAPMVTASAAMLWALEPELSVSEVRHYLLDYAGEAYNENGAVFPMLNVGASVEALAAGGSQGSGPDEEGMENADDTVTPNGMSGGELSEGDYSKGVYRMGGIAERRARKNILKSSIRKGKGIQRKKILRLLWKK